MATRSVCDPIRYGVRVLALALLVVAACMGTGAVCAQAESMDPYVVGDVRVDVRAESALKARDKAFAEAQAKAFRVLIPRLVLDQARAASIPIPPENERARFISDVEVTNERRSDTRYVATYAIRFIPEVIDAYLAQRGGSGIAQPYPAAPESGSFAASGPAAGVAAGGGAVSQVGALPVLLVPAYQRGSAIDLWSADNPWRRAWQTRDAVPGLALPVIPSGDDADRTAWPADRLFTYGQGGAGGAMSAAPAPIGFLRHRYRVPTVLIALLNDGGGAVTGSVQSGGARLTAQRITLYRADAERPTYIDTLIVPPSPRAHAEDAFAAARMTVLGHLNNPAAQRQIAATLPTTLPMAVQTAPAAQSGPSVQVTALPNTGTAGAAPVRRIQLQVDFATLQEWSQIRQLLAQAGPIQGINLASLRAGQAVMTAQVVGDDASLRDALGRAGLQLTDVRSPLVYRVSRLGAPARP